MRTLVTNRTTNMAALEQRLVQFAEQCGVLSEFSDKMVGALAVGEGGTSLTGAVKAVLLNDRSDLPSDRISGHVTGPEGEPLVMVEGIPQHRFLFAVEYIANFRDETEYAWHFMLVVPETRGSTALVITLECRAEAEDL